MICIDLHFFASKLNDSPFLLHFGFFEIGRMETQVYRDESVLFNVLSGHILTSAFCLTLLFFMLNLRLLQSVYFQ